MARKIYDWDDAEQALLDGLVKAAKLPQGDYAARNFAEGLKLLREAGTIGD